MPAHFNNIRKVIEGELKKAKFDIYIAVAWFTDMSLFETICSKAKKGVNVRIILKKDKINSATRFDHRDIEKYGGKFFFRDHHHKFCVIDRKILINGSSNWTYKAFQSRVEENITISDDEKEALKFANIFLDLEKKAIDVENIDFTDYFKLKFVASFQRVIDMLYEEDFAFSLPKGGIKNLWRKPPYKAVFINKNKPDEEVFVIVSPQLREVLEKVGDKLLYLPVFSIVDKSGKPFNNSFVLGLESNNEQRFDPTWTM